MINQVYKQLEEEFKSKTNNKSLFNDFCYTYIIESSSDSDILEVTRNKDITTIKVKDYFNNNNIFILAIKVLTLLEVSQNFKTFQKLYKLLKTDKQNNTVEFDKVLINLLKN